MKRRSALAMLTVIGLDAVAGEAAGFAPPPGLKFKAILLKIVHAFLHAEEVFITKYLTDLILGYERQVLPAPPSGNGVAVAAGDNPRLTVTVKPHHSKKHLVVNAVVEDANGERYVAHTGIAPHHKHKDMLNHLNEIARKTHEWLKARNQ